MPESDPKPDTHGHYNSHRNRNSDHPSHSNADGERLPRRRVYTITNTDRYSYGHRHGDTTCDSEPNAKSNGNAFTTSAGIEYLDSIAR